MHVIVSISVSVQTYGIFECDSSGALCTQYYIKQWLTLMNWFVFWLLLHLLISYYKPVIKSRKLLDLLPKQRHNATVTMAEFNCHNSAVYTSTT